MQLLLSQKLVAIVMIVVGQLTTVQDYSLHESFLLPGLCTYMYVCASLVLLRLVVSYHGYMYMYT